MIKTLLICESRASALACSGAITLKLPPVSVSSPTINVSSVSRATPAEPRPARRASEANLTEFGPDVAEGISSGRLADLFSALFEPMDEPEVDSDYTFS